VTGSPSFAIGLPKAIPSAEPTTILPPHVVLSPWQSTIPVAINPSTYYGNNPRGHFTNNHPMRNKYQT
ncbi:MAG: hypothetical protein WAK61_09235, partial [Leclercia sp.]